MGTCSRRARLRHARALLRRVHAPSPARHLARAARGARPHPRAQRSPRARRRLRDRQEPAPARPPRLRRRGLRPVGRTCSRALAPRCPRRPCITPTCARCRRSIGIFDWITCLDDALNYLLGDDDLASALASMARLLRAGGLLTFDLNSLSAHRDGFAATWVVEEPGLFLCWEGRGCGPARGEPGSADISIFERADGAWLRHASRHEQRWWGIDDVRRACAAAGLTLVAVHGQLPGARLQADVDESTAHQARLPGAPCPRRRPRKEAPHDPRPVDPPARGRRRRRSAAAPPRVAQGNCANRCVRARPKVCQLRCRGGSLTTETKKSSIWRTTSMKRSKSTGLLT